MRLFQKELRTIRIDEELIRKYAQDIMESDNFKQCETYTHHGNTSVKEHSILVASIAWKLSRKFAISVDQKELIRGALLHDYFLYDWHHNPNDRASILRFYKKHGFTHPEIALKNAKEEYDISHKQEDIILKHMWPLTVIPPTCREAWLVMVADKISAVMETTHMLQ